MNGSTKCYELWVAHFYELWVEYTNQSANIHELWAANINRRANMNYGLQIIDGPARL